MMYNEGKLKIAVNYVYLTPISLKKPRAVQGQNFDKQAEQELRYNTPSKFYNINQTNKTNATYLIKLKPSNYFQKSNNKK